MIYLQSKDDFLGSSVVLPTVRLSLDIPAPKLYWVDIVRCNKPAGEVLAAFELLLDDGDTALPPLPSKAYSPHTHYLVPEYIRPVLQKTRIEVMKNKIALSTQNVGLYELVTLV